jgi:hypothetical protein
MDSHRFLVACDPAFHDLACLFPQVLYNYSVAQKAMSRPGSFSRLLDVVNAFSLDWYLLIQLMEWLLDLKW